MKSLENEYTPYTPLLRNDDDYERDRILDELRKKNRPEKRPQRDINCATSCWYITKGILNMPVIASCVAIALCFFPSIRVFLTLHSFCF